MTTTVRHMTKILKQPLKELKRTVINKANSGDKMKSKLCDSIHKKVKKGGGGRGTKNRWKTISKMWAFNLIMSIITLNINNTTQIKVRSTDWISSKI